MTLQEMIDDARRIVFFGGAGVSTESGIKDFRSQDGLYHMKYDYPPEEILSHTFFMHQPKEFFKFYRDKLISGLTPEDYLEGRGIQPNPAHLKLAELEKAGKLSAVITQNIDGLHQLAGSKKVLELHGSVMRNYCPRCGRFYGVEAMTDPELLDKDGIPRCQSCRKGEAPGAVIKPDVVLYEEGLDEKILRESVYEMENADMLIVGGTSLNVYPAAGLLYYFKGKYLVLINKQPTGADRNADLVIREPIGEVLAKITV
ncbi:MAG: NAD-dependent protein deacylase [Firmicutes bacterium]|nr:NAD-dependent protein deacylase [Bacillota bacterium]